MSRRSLPLVLCLLLCSPALATTLYIADSGNGGDDESDTNDCETSNNPCATWDYVFSLFSAGDTIVVKDGSTFDSTDGGNGSVTSTNCGATHGSKTYSLVLPDKSCVVGSQCTIQAETNADVTPEGWKDLSDENPNWKIENRGTGHGCIAIVGTSGSTNDYWNVSGFECNTDLGIANCYADNITMSDFIADVDMNSLDTFYISDGGTDSLFMYNIDTVTWSGFRYRGVLQNHHGSGYIETPGWLNPHGPGTTATGTGGARILEIESVTDVVFEDFDFGHWPFGGNIQSSDGVTFKRGSFGLMYNHAIELIEYNSNVLVENVVFYQAPWGHCWDGDAAPNESTPSNRSALQATITSKRCFVDGDCSGEGASNVCRTDDMFCTVTAGTTTPSDLTGICGTCPADTKTCKTGASNEGRVCTTDAFCGGGAGDCRLDTKRCGGPITNGAITIFDGSGIIFRNNSYILRDRGYQAAWGHGYNLGAPGSNAGAPNKCGTEPSATNVSICKGTAGGSPTTCIADGGCGSTCYDVCIWDDVAFYNNILMEVGEETKGDHDHGYFIDIFDSIYMKLGGSSDDGDLDDELYIDCNVYSGAHSTSGSQDRFQCGFNDDTFLDLAAWQADDCNDVDVWSGSWDNDPPVATTDCSEAASDEDCDHPATPFDAESSYIADMTSSYFEDYDVGDYRPSSGSALIGLMGANCDGNDPNSIDRCASEDYYGNARGSGSCTPGAFHVAGVVEDCGSVGDEDGDGDADCADSECFPGTGPSGETCEQPSELTCADGFDNDGDGDTDEADSDCGAATFRGVTLE